MSSATNPNEEQYLLLLEDVLANGVRSADRTGTGTLSVFGRQTRFDLRDGFPLVTTKQVPWKGITSELLWFIEGSGDERRLAEIRYGKPRDELVGKTTIWTENAQAPYWKPKAKYEGDLGRPYGVQWRKWRVPVLASDGLGWGCKSIDQLRVLIDGIKKDPYGRRHILSAWNPGELDQMTLPPCHRDVQFYVRDNTLSAMVSIRSWDLFLGGSFNIASYALFTMMIAQVCGMEAGEVIINSGDTHIYLDHIDQVKEQLTRQPHEAPTVTLNPRITDIDRFTMADITLTDYIAHPPIKAAMAV